MNITDAVFEIEKLKRQLSDAKAAHKIALTEFYDLATLHSPLVVEHENAKVRIVEIDTENGELKRKLKDTRVELKIQDEANDILTRQLSELKGRTAAFRQDYKTACDSISDLTRQLSEARAEIARLKDFRGGTIHNAWLTAPREKLIEALQFHGSTTKEAFKLVDKYRAEIAQLQSWKREALAVESTWDCQTVGRLLGVKLGANIRSKIQPGIVGLKNEIVRLRKALETTHFLMLEGKYGNAKIEMEQALEASDES